jgi:hypothetical protein
MTRSRCQVAALEIEVLSPVLTFEATLPPSFLSQLSYLSTLSLSVSYMQMDPLALQPIISTLTITQSSFNTNFMLPNLETLSISCDYLDNIIVHPDIITRMLESRQGNRAVKPIKLVTLYIWESSLAGNGKVDGVVESLRRSLKPSIHDGLHITVNHKVVHARD